MAKQKIFHIIPSLMSGGAERLLTDLIAKTSAEKFSHTVCVFGEASFFAPDIIKTGNEVIELNITGKRPWLTAARKISPLVRERQPDLIVSWLYDATITSRLVWLRHKTIPIINTLHSLDYDPETIKAGNWSPKKVKILQTIDKISAKFTDPYFVACSKSVAESYKKNLDINPSRIKVIYNFIDPESLISEKNEAQNLRKSLGIPENSFVYINVGRLDAPKGQTYLLQAFPKVLAAVPNAHLVIVGTGHLETIYKELAKSLKIDHRTHILGSRKDIGNCLQMADVFVFPTLFEGFGIALVEAMAKKISCIATDLEVIREIIEDNVSGMLIAPASAPDLAKKMIELHDQPALRKEFADEAFRKAEKCFFSDVIIPQWEELYSSISNKNNQ